MQLAMPHTEPCSESEVDTVSITELVSLHHEGELGLVVVAGAPWALFDAADEAAENWAMVCLVRNGLATIAAVARAFGVDRNRVYRSLRRYEQGGVEALVHRRRGPKGARILKGKVAARMMALHRQGVPNTQIAARLGVTEGAVRYALGRQGVQPAAPKQLALALPLPPQEGQAEQRSPAVPAEPSPSQSLSEFSGGCVEPELSEAQKATVHGTERAWDRSVDRALARAGHLVEARPQFGPACGVRGAGALLALPSLAASGLLEQGARLLCLGAGFYGLRGVLMTLWLMALLRIRRPEALRRRSPVDLGRLLGLDRAPEVKTLRGKLRAMGQQYRSEELMMQLARRRAEAEAEAMGYLYVDGHVRAYHGKRTLPKTHVARIRLSMPATVDHWVNDRQGDPLLVVTATETASLARELPGVLAKVRQTVGDGRRVTVVFDRGGWSPKLFAQMVSQGFDVLTYRKGKIPPVPTEDFEEHVGQVDGRTVRYQLAERPLPLLGGELQLREVVRLCSDGQHQTSIVTSRQDLPAAEVAFRMFERWRQENFFKYMRQHYALDALCGYGTESGDAQRLVPNPARKVIERELKAARDALRKLEQQLGAAACDNEESARPTMRGFKIANADIGRPLSAARQRVEELKERRRKTPVKVTAQQAAGDDEVLRLDRQTKRLTDVVKMVAYQAETALLHMLRPHYARHEDEGRSLVASALALKGDLEVHEGQLRVTLEPMASPNRTRALAAVCQQLNETDTRYPGTSLVMRYAVREPGSVTI